MSVWLASLREILHHKLFSAFTVRFRKGPIDTLDGLADFVQTRAAYVAQTSLYGYLKNRMGISYPEMFSDEKMAMSINIAKWKTYGACLADLAIFSAALVRRGGHLTDDQAAKLAGHCFDYSVEESFDDSDAEKLMDEIKATFSHQLAQVDWSSVADGENAFLNSPVQLVRFAPIADELKKYDADIVINSTRFRWRDIRNQLRERLRPGDAASNYLSTLN